MLIHEDPYRTEVAQFLKGRGYSLSKTAEIMGLSKSTVRRVLDPELYEEHLSSKRRAAATRKAELQAVLQELDNLPF
jgi:predicted transcriptional regulator